MSNTFCEARGSKCGFSYRGGGRARATGQSGSGRWRSAHLALLPHTEPSHIPGGRDAFDGVLLLTAPAGGGEFDAGAVDRVRSLSPYRFSIVDGRIDTSHFELLKANGVALAVIGAELFAGSDHVERAKRLADLVAAQGTDLVPRVCRVPR